MATYMDVGRVLYKAGTSFNPLCYLYFCRHCLKLRSTGCVFHEVDSHYCPNCLENMPSAEAKVKKNRCMACYDCPSCSHTLSVRATNVSATDGDGQMTPRKVYYLACGFCRWTSRDIGLKDQSVSSGGWPALENTDDKRIATLTSYYRQLAQREKLEKDKKKYSRRKSYMQFTTDEAPLQADKYGLSAVAARRRSGVIGSGRDLENMKIEDIDPSPAAETVADDLPDDIFTKPLNLAHVTTISQRHSSPEQQPSTTDHLYPRHKHLLIKQSLRCRECDHNLCKPEFNPSSIKFKIQLVALHHVPEIRISALPIMKVDQPTQVILTLCNPLDFLTHVTLLPCDPDTDVWSTAKIELAQCELVLARCDDAAEYDENIDQQQVFEDDPAVIVFRKANKIGFCVTITPLQPNNDVKVRMIIVGGHPAKYGSPTNVCAAMAVLGIVYWVSFRMKHDYRNIISAAAADKQAANDNIVWLEHQVNINLGSVSIN